MLASLNQNRYRINRKPGQINLYNDLVLQVETLEGDIMKGVNYTWTFPQGITGTVDPAARHKTTVNKVGNYKVNVTGSGGVSCPLEIDVSALACATPADFIACGNTGSVTTTGTEKLKNLAVGDEFSTYDYIVRVTEVSGSETSGWTGKGELVMNFLKIGSSPVVEIPLAVKFENMHLNQCYQILPGSKVITEFDPNWSNIVDVDNITDRISAVYAEIKDLLAYDPGNTAALQAKVAELNSIKADFTSSGFRPEYITEQTTAVNSAIASVSCYAAAPGARLTNSCTADDVTTALDNAENVQYSSINPYFGDVFDENGNRLANESSTSANTANEFVIIKASVLGTSIPKYLKLGEYNFVTANKVGLYNSIMKHYWMNELNFSSSSLYNSNFTINVIGSPNLTFNPCSTCYVEPSNIGIMSTLITPATIIGFINKEGRINRYFLQEKWILVSVLYHEAQHLFGLHTIGEKEDVNKVLIHLEVYFRQFQHSSFLKTSSSFRSSMWNTINEWYIGRLSPHYMNDYHNWKNKFKKLNIPEVK